MIKIFNYFIQTFLIYLFFIIGRVLGLKISRKIFAYIFSLLGPHFKSKKIIKRNLKIFSHRVKHLDEKRIINNMWKNYGMTFIEYSFLSHFKKGNTLVSIKDNANLSKIIHDQKPVIFISGHFANFELMSMEITKKKIPLATIYRPLNNIFLNPLMEYLRKKYICKNQIKKGIKGVKETINYIKNKNSIAIMIDQRVSEGKKINLFNQPALTTTLPAHLSTKFDMDIIPVYIERNTENNFKIEFQKRIKPVNFKDKIELTKELNKVLEQMIINNPNQWIWTHNRWK
ncbi:lysophospholipid acyltransferase family protein [Pelagibacteraceae bacterium]|nr:lysophospholipid acyltransferase family protein [Pelagibacteraceae bacterium]